MMHAVDHDAYLRSMQMRTSLQEAAEFAPVGATLPALTRFRGVSRFLARQAARFVYTAASALTGRQRRYNFSLLQAVVALADRVEELERESSVLRQRLGLPELPPSGPRCRPDTLDWSIWQSVVVHNEYRLPRQFQAADTVLDVGAHIGGFSYACLIRGAGRVFAFEPEPANYELACHNLASFGPRVRVENRAVWRSDGPDRQLFHTPSLDPRNTGGGGVFAADGGTPVASIGLDVFLDELAARHGVQRVRLLKVDCEGSEYPVLLTSRKLHLIDEICGEYHEYGDDLPEHLRLDGVARFDRHALKEGLQAQGFRVELVPTGTPGQSNLGLFFAKRR
jgi:FkbM family methyltransferase